MTTTATPSKRGQPLTARSAVLLRRFNESQECVTSLFVRDCFCAQLLRRRNPSAWLFTVDGQAHSMHGSNGSHSINNGTAPRVVGYAGDLNMAYSHNAGLTPIAAASVRCDPRFRDAGNTTTGHESEPLVQKYDYVLGLGSGRKRPRRCCDMLSFGCGNLAVLSAAFLLLFFAYNTLQVRLAPTSVVVCVSECWVAGEAEGAFRCRLCCFSQPSFRPGRSHRDSC